MEDGINQEVLDGVAPCALVRYTCPACREGAISKCATELLKYFEGYYEFNDARIWAVSARSGLILDF